MINNACNMEYYKTGFCTEIADWKHPRWPQGKFCDHHKLILEGFFPREWTRLSAEKKEQR